MASATAILSSSLLPKHSLSLTSHVNRSTKVSTFTIVAQKKVKKVRQVILKEDIMNVGNKGELLEVRLGYYRNYLLPKGMAVIVTPESIKEMKKEEERIEAEKIRVKEEALLLAQMFETFGAFKVKRQVGKGKLIFGTVTSQDFVDIVKAQLQRDLDKRMVTMPEIRETGEYIVELRLHPDVSAREETKVRSQTDLPKCQNLCIATIGAGTVIIVARGKALILNPTLLTELCISSHKMVVLKAKD